MPTCTRIELGGGSRALYQSGFLEHAVATQLFHELFTSVPWRQGTIALFGRQVTEPRLSAWYGAEDYVYSGRRMTARPRGHRRFPRPRRRRCRR